MLTLGGSRNAFLFWYNFQWEDEDNADLPSDQEGVELGWFNDLYVFDTGTAWKITGKTNLFFF